MVKPGADQHGEFVRCSRRAVAQPGASCSSDESPPSGGPCWLICHWKPTRTTTKALTLCKRLLYISPYPSERVLRRVRRGGAGRRGADGHGDGPADGVAGGGARGACPLGLQRQGKLLICFPRKYYMPSHCLGPMLKTVTKIPKHEEFSGNCDAILT